MSTTAQTTQALVLDAIVTGIEAENLTAAIDGEWANTGSVRAFDGLDLVGEVRYDFQRQSVRFGPMMSPVAVHYYGNARTPGQVEAVKSSLAEVVAAVVSEVTGVVR